MIPIAEWTPAPQGILTSQERLVMVQRIFTRERIGEIGIYAHGTAVIRFKTATLDLDALLRRYDLPQDGAGSPLGDIRPTLFDGPEALLPSLIGVSAMDHDLMRAELWARRQRTLDAQQCVQIAHWSAG